MELKSKKVILAPLEDEQLRGLIDSVPEIDTKKEYNRLLVSCMEHPKDIIFYTLWKIEDPVYHTMVGTLYFNGPADKNSTVMLTLKIFTPYQSNGLEEIILKMIANWAFKQKDILFLDLLAKDFPTEILSKQGFKVYMNSKEGPVYTKSKEPESYLAVYLSIGVSLGICLGLALDNYYLYFPLMTCLGISLGALFDSLEREKIKKILSKKIKMAEGEN